jgi:uncharacterized membrane protein
MTIPNDFSPKARQSSPMLWALVVSIVLNLFLVGVLASNACVLLARKHFALMGLATTHSEQIMDRMIETLDSADAAAFREIVQPQADALKQAHEQVQKAVKAVAAAYAQDPPNSVTLQSAIQTWGQARADLNNVVGKILQDSYGKLSPEGRHRLAELKR